MNKAVQGTAKGIAAAKSASKRAPSPPPSTDAEASPAVSQAIASPDPTPAQHIFSKPHAIDSIFQFGSHLVIRLWAVDATDFIRIMLRSKGVSSRDTLVTTLFYARPDVNQHPDARVFGLTILLSDPVLLGEDEVEILLVSQKNEVLVIRGKIQSNDYADFLAGILFDIQRAGRPIEQRLLFDRSMALVKLLQSSWAHYLGEQKRAFTSYGKSYRPATYSIITVFYRRTFLAGLYAFTARILDLPPQAEVILCFQQGAIFQQQINYLEGLFQLFQINYKFVLFEENVGFSAANNVAVEQSLSPRILLVNPDIFCNDPAIYGKIAEATEDGNVYGATLLSDADEVMHNGIELLEQTVTFKSKAMRVLRTSHIDRHSPVELIEEDGVSDAEAVSGALLAVTRTTWDRLGGLPEHFVYAHFEDVEFCRTAARAGLKVRVYNSRQLVHLESYGSGEDSLLGAIKQVNSAIFNLGAR